MKLRGFLSLASASVLATFLSGCAGNSAEIQTKRAELERTTPICIDAADCNAKWEAAQLWIVHNAGYKLQTATNVLLQTYNSTDRSSTDIMVQATKEPMGGGKYKIAVSVSCSNMFGCVPNQWDAALSFNRTVSAVTP